jgi:hypothetical protein
MEDENEKLRVEHAHYMKTTQVLAERATVTNGETVQCQFPGCTHNFKVDRQMRANMANHFLRRHALGRAKVLNVCVFVCVLLICVVVCAA